MKSIPVYFLLSLIFVFILNDKTFPEGFSNIRFINTLSYDYYSTKLEDDSRTDHLELLNNESFSSVDEYLQTYIYPYSENGFFWGINLIASMNENYTKKAGGEAQVGYGNFKVPFCSFGWFIVYQRDMVYNNPKKINGGANIHIGYPDANHLFIDGEGNIDGGRKLMDMLSLNIDFVLGSSDYSYFRFNLEGRQNYDASENSNIDYSHGYSKIIAHVQLYHANYDFSAGYSFYGERFGDLLYDSDNNEIDENEYKKSRYHGAGITAAYKDFFEGNLTLFGEFHLLGNRNENPPVMIICEFGTKIYI